MEKCKHLFPSKTTVCWNVMLYNLVEVAIPIFLLLVCTVSHPRRRQPQGHLHGSLLKFHCFAFSPFSCKGYNTSRLLVRLTLAICNHYCRSKKKAVLQGYVPLFLYLLSTNSKFLCFSLSSLIMINL
jgi:hypothetical protein